MSRRSTVEDWRRAVFRASYLTGNVQVLLLRMAEHMRADRKVSVPRDQLAAELNVHPQRVAERIKAARSLGWLDKTGGGYRGRTAEYQGTFGPQNRPECVPILSTHSTPKTGTHSQNGSRSAAPECVPDGEYATTTAEPSRGVENRNGATDEEPPRPPAPMRDWDCTWHPFELCPDDCASADRRTSA